MTSKTQSPAEAVQEVAENLQGVVREATRDVVQRAQVAGGEALDRIKTKASGLSTSQKIAVGVGAVGAAVAGLAAVRLAARKLGKVRDSV